MSQELTNKIEQYLTDHRQDIDKVLAPAELSFEDIDQFLDIVASGGIELASLTDFLMLNNPEMTLEQSFLIQEELFDKVFIEIDDELEEQREEFLKVSSKFLEEIELEELQADPTSVKLQQVYQRFLNTEELKRLVVEISQEVTDYEPIKNQFYEAINNKDRLGFVTALAKIFSSGKIKELFTNDERYVKFWRNRILKDKGLEGVRKFDENSLRREQFGSFIKHVIEERFEIPTEDAVLWGVFFSSLAHRAGDTDYDRLAYGDLKDQQFKWNL